MKLIRLLALALLSGVLSLNARAQNSGPFLWTSFIDVFGNYVQRDSQSTVVSRFTPGVAITVTRMQLQAAQGGYIFLTGAPCSPLPKVKVTDGTTEYLLAVPNAKNSGPYPHSVHADSGLIAVSFPDTAEIRLSALPGEKGCNPASINVLVQYSVN